MLKINVYPTTSMVKGLQTKEERINKYNANTYRKLLL